MGRGDAVTMVHPEGPAYLEIDELRESQNSVPELTALKPRRIPWRRTCSRAALERRELYRQLDFVERRQSAFGIYVHIDVLRLGDVHRVVVVL